MFQQSIFDDQESRRPWTFSVSLLAQLLLIAVAILMPLLSKPLTPVLNAALVSLQAPKPPASAPPPPQLTVVVKPEIFHAELMQPRNMPERAAVVIDPSSDDIGPQRATIPGAPVGPLAGGVISRLVSHGAVSLPPKPVAELAPSATPIRVSSEVQAARIVQRAQPVYPPLAIKTRVSGVVRLQAVIAADGTIAELNVVSGHPLLIRAAIDAVRQWRYRPTVLNGTPVPVDTQIDVNFKLAR